MKNYQRLVNSQEHKLIDSNFDHKKTFTVHVANDKLWEIPNLIGYLVINQGKDIFLNVNPEAQSLEATELYEILDKFKFKSVTIYTWNKLENHKDYRIVHKKPELFFANKIWEGWDKVAFELFDWSKRFRFSVYYGRPTANRLGIAARLYNKFLDKTNMVLAFDPSTCDSRLSFELEKLFSYDVSALEEVSKIIKHLPINLEMYKPLEWVYHNENPLIYKYKDSLIDIISEPNILGSTFFFTEKTTRPMFFKRPFIAMAGQDFLCYLRQMGFKTFYEFWDESYDGFSGRDRYLKIIDLLEHLGSLSDNEILAMYLGMKDILEHNYYLLQNQTFSKNVTKI